MRVSQGCDCGLELQRYLRCERSHRKQLGERSLRRNPGELIWQIFNRCNLFLSNMELLTLGIVPVLISIFHHHISMPRRFKKIRSEIWCRFWQTNLIGHRCQRKRDTKTALGWVHLLRTQLAKTPSINTIGRETDVLSETIRTFASTVLVVHPCCPLPSPSEDIKRKTYP